MAKESQMLTVIIPCYNCEGFLRRAIDSVLSQSYSDWEMILVNNSSTDGTQKVIDEYVQRFPEKIFSFFESRKGACFARNFGLSQAKGEWIQFLDADDEILPDKFERQLNIIEDATIVLIGAFIRVYVEKGTSERFYVYPNRSIWYSILFSQAGITSANLYKKKAVLDINGWNTEMSSSQEYDLMFRLAKASVNNAICYDTAFSSRIYEETNSVSRPKDEAGKKKIIENYVELRLRIAEYLSSKGMWNDELRRVYSKSIFRLLYARRVPSSHFVNTKMNGLGLSTPCYYKTLIILKYYTKRLLIRNF